MAYQVVPPSQVVSTNISTFALVLVKVGEVPPLHLIAAPQVTALAVPSIVNARVIPNAFPVVGMLLMVSVVIAAFKLTANTLPSEQFSVSVPLDIDGAVFVSTRLVIVAVVSVGEVAKTASPDPVSSVNAAAKFADYGVARKVATFVPSPLTPVETGSPVQLVSVPLEGVPRPGVTSVGLVSTTNFEPVPVWLAITVALPVLVITPVRFAFVVTVAAEPVVF